MRIFPLRRHCTSVKVYLRSTGRRSTHGCKPYPKLLGKPAHVLLPCAPGWRICAMRWGLVTS